MSNLPTGTVTFLFTDIEGSTAVWEQHPEEMRQALARHDAVLAAGVERRGGIVVKSRGEGDSVFAVFAHASDAVAAAVDLQRALQAEAWPTQTRLRVRMALHTGEAELRDGDYYGAAVNRCARLRAAGHGGQILLSQATYDLIRDAPPADVGIVDLGEYRLKDLVRPERVFQVAGPGLPSDFPPLRTLGSRPHNLPVQPTPLIGREREVEAARRLLLEEDVRLLTLTGPGGTGKTRLGLQVAAELLEHFPEGVYFVALAPIGDPALVPSTIAQALGIRDVGSRPVQESLKEHLRDRQLLLVLDNFEQILPAAPAVSDLLGAGPKLKILVTSRAPLQVRGEHELAVPPLPLPDRKRPPPVEALGQYGAIALFIERAAAIKADFAVTDENARAVGAICQRLDGLPLAIELAAARIRLLSPQAMLARLERRLPLLVGGARDLPARQQTLRGAIAWSYDLLSAEEQALFRRLAVFVGGCTLEAAAAVCDPDGELGLDVLDGVASLAAKSLLRQSEGADGEPRIGMLETIREFGLEQLEASGEADATRRAHAAFFLALAEQAEPELLGREQLTWLRRLDLEHDNLRAVLGWSQDRQVADDVGLRLTGALAWFWSFRGFPREGHGWATAMLAAPGAVARTVVGARAHATAAFTAVRLASTQAEYAAVRRLARESAAMFREVGDLQGVGRALTLEGLGGLGEGNYAAVRRLFEEGATIAREVGDRWGLAFAVGQLGSVAQGQGDYAAARRFREESAAAAREIGDRFTLGLALAGLALLARLEANHARSVVLFKEALVVASELEDPVVTSRSLAGLAGAASLDADYDRAARLFGAAEALREATGASELPLWRAIFDPEVAEVRAGLGDEAFTSAWAAGRAMSREQALAYALDASVPV